MPEDKAYQLLQEGEYGVMSMITPEGMPYGIPINYVWMEMIACISIVLQKERNYVAYSLRHKYPLPL